MPHRGFRNEMNAMKFHGETQGAGAKLNLARHDGCLIRNDHFNEAAGPIKKRMLGVGCTCARVR